MNFVQACCESRLSPVSFFWWGAVPLRVNYKVLLVPSRVLAGSISPSWDFFGLMMDRNMFVGMLQLRQLRPSLLWMISSG